jgi:hypothetical protein
MARSRNIKPSFFTNDDLAEIPALGRLLFIGLWTLSDREGRLEDRPKRIKAQLFAYDEVDCDAMLGELERAGFIQRYVAQGVRCIYIVNFLKHQMPHHKEAASELPPPDGMPAITRHAYDVSPAKRDEIFDRDGRKCLKCGTEDSLSLDHIVPLSAGGTNDDDNLQTLCKRCNSAKGDTTKDHRQSNVGSTSIQRRVNRSAPCPSDSGFPLTDSGFPLTDSPSRIQRIESAPPAKQAANRSPSGSRIPDGFPAAEHLDWCRSERPDLDAEQLREKFRDYWIGVPGQKGRKADWSATWRNFVRGEFHRPPTRASPPRHSAAAEAGLALAGMNRNRSEVIDV